MPGKTNPISKNGAQPAGLPVRTDVRSGDCRDEFRTCAQTTPRGLFSLNECAWKYEICKNADGPWKYEYPLIPTIPIG